MVIPYKTSDDFVGKAKNDGKVTEINEKLSLVKVTYKDGSTDIFKYGDTVGESSGSMINHRIALHPGVTVGASFKKGSIITYHQDFFQYDPFAKQLAWCHGIPASLAIMPKDITLEDSSMITSELSDKLSLASIHTRPIQISTNMVIESFVDIGSYVKFNDSLIKLKYEDTVDIIDDVDDLFSELQQVEYKSKNEGIVTDIQVYYVEENLNESLTAFIKKITSKERAQMRFAKDSTKEANYTPVNIVPEGTRVRGYQLAASDVLIIFSIKTNISCGIGDKIVAGNMLKSVIGKIELNPITTEDGKKIDIVFGANSIFDRIVCSVFIQGMSNTIIESAEDEVVKMYFGE